MDSAVYAKNYLDLRRLYPLKMRLRSIARDTALFFLSLKSRKNSLSECIYFPCYHHVLDDERKGFERQILFLKNVGEFISLNHAVELLREKKKIGGRYFCITFDDGFKNFLTNAKPILHGNSCPGAIFVPTSHIGSDFPHRLGTCWTSFTLLPNPPTPDLWSSFPGRTAVSFWNLGTPSAHIPAITFL